MPRPYETVPLAGPPTHALDQICALILHGRWYRATPTAIREMALQTALAYTSTHLDSYTTRNPENLPPSEMILQLLWLGSSCHIDVSRNQLPTLSKLMPSTLKLGLTKLFDFSRRKRGPHIRKTDKGMGLALQSKQWLRTERAKVILDPNKYIIAPSPSLFLAFSLCRKFTKNVKPVPGRILTQGFSYLEASAKFIRFFGYAILKEISKEFGFHEIRAEYAYKGLDMALDQIHLLNMDLIDMALS